MNAVPARNRLLYTILAVALVRRHRAAGPKLEAREVARPNSAVAESNSEGSAGRNLFGHTEPCLRLVAAFAGRLHTHQSKPGESLLLSLLGMLELAVTIAGVWLFFSASRHT